MSSRVLRARAGLRYPTRGLDSAPAVIAEAELLRFVMVGIEAEDWRWWERRQLAEAHGLSVADDPALARAFGDALDLAERLRRFAQQVVTHKALGYTG